MRRLTAFSFSLYLLAIISTSLLILTLRNNAKAAIPLSPLPLNLTTFNNRQVSSVDLWVPNFEEIDSPKLEKPFTTAKSALVYDLSTNKLLFQKEPKIKLPMASLTKIMTAVIALENQRNSDEYLVSADALVGEDTMGLAANEILSLEHLLYGLMLNSGNDSAETIAGNFPRGRKAFIEAMNKKALSLGIRDTNYTNPSGLEGDGDQYTTAYDLLVITNFALNHFPAFNKVVNKAEYYIPATDKHGEYFLTNETNLLTSYPGVKGVKVGYTPEAGYSLVTYLEYKGHKIVGILLNSQNRRQEMKDLLDYSLKVQGVTPPLHQ